jgi:hypothetical protein
MYMFVCEAANQQISGKYFKAVNISLVPAAEA